MAGLFSTDPAKRLRWQCAIPMEEARGIQRTRDWRWGLAAIRLMISSVALACLLLSAIGCATTYPNRNPVGELFPAVSGRTLTEEPRDLPGHFHGSQVVLLLGYEQDSQFDIDRWLIGLDQTRTQVTAFEIPTIRDCFPGCSRPA